MIGIIILNWNGSTLLREYLPSVVRNTPRELADIIVADNGSDDDSLAVLEHDFPEVKVIKLDKNHGFAGGYNRAIDKALEIAAYSEVVLLNSDVLTPQGWLEPMAEYLSSHPTVAAVQPKLLQDRDDDVQEFEYSGASGGFLDKHGYPYCRGRVFSHIELDEGQYDDAVPVFWASGACMLIRVGAFNEVGGFDEEFFAHMEEIDLCWRLQIKGHGVAVVPSSSVYHLGGGSLPKSNPRKTYLNFRNNLLMLHKNLPKEEGKRLLLIRRLYDALAVVQTTLKLHFRDVGAIIRAHRDFRVMRERYSDCQPEANLLQTFPCCRINIIVQHFLLFKNKFSKLSYPKN